MWVERISARAFGPFRDAVLELGPGLTVVVGPNEAGKSSWHAALRLALTGRRRGRGGRTAEDRETEEQYRPWDDADGLWEVEARLHLDDGRVIEINQDLAGKVDCRAMDVGLGRDVSAEIIVDGSPDASRWLGLDRHAFAATLSVDQSRIMAVIEAADGLQDDMQRAAATAGRDATAAEAIARLAEFRKAAVGADTRVAVGPLRQARQASEGAEQALAHARARHHQHLALAAAAQVAAARLVATRERVRRAEAVVDQSRTGALLARVRRAAELTARHPGPPPALEAAHHDTAAVATALEAWRGRPAPAVLDGPDSAEIARQLSALPAVPDGDVAPHASVLAAVRALDQAEGAAAELSQADGPPPESSAAGRVLVGAGLVAAATGVGFVVFDLPVIGVILVALGLGLAGFGAVRLRSGIGGAATTPGQRRDEADSRVRQASEAVRAALGARGEPTDGDVHDAISAYTSACARRASESAQAAQAEPLRLRLEARRQLEEAAAEAARVAARAEGELRAAALRVGVPAGGIDPQQLVGELEAWEQRRVTGLRAGEEAIAEWQELTDLLEGRPLEEWQADAGVAAARLDAAGLSATVPIPAGSDAGLVTATAEDALAATQAELLAAERETASLDGEARQQGVGLPSVAEAEEAVDSARVELVRVEALAAVLDRTLALLRTAEEQVHRDLAPVLADAVRRFLPRVSGARYIDVMVDPRDLRVQVREAATSQWRDARRLSEGTREQIYLLLRVAMALHLVTTGETAPLILDEVTAQSDDTRRQALLEILHELSRERQIVLFTHDLRVAAWAEAHRDGARDLVVPLAGLAAVAS